MTTEAKRKRIDEVLASVAWIIPGEVSLEYRSGTSLWEINIPLVFELPGPKVANVRGGTEILLEGKDRDAVVDEALALVELLVGLNPDDRLEEEEPSDPRELSEALSQARPKAQAQETQVESFPIELSEKGLILALRDGRLISEIESRYLARLVAFLDPGGDYAFQYGGRAVESLREKARAAGIGSSDSAAWLVAYSNYMLQAHRAHFFLQKASEAFRMILAKENWDTADIAGAIRSGLVGKPSDSTLLIARLLSELYLAKLKG